MRSGEEDKRALGAHLPRDRREAAASPEGALQNVGVALRALRTNALRSLLTLLGIIIVVASVVAIAAIGEGAHARVA